MKLALFRTSIEAAPPSAARRRVLAVLDVAEAAEQLAKVTSHGNLTGAEYAARRELYDCLRDAIERMEETP